MTPRALVSFHAGLIGSLAGSGAVQDTQRDGGRGQRHAITLAGVKAGGAILALLPGILAPRVLAGRRPAATAAGAAA